jgi:hypothetical protein
MVELGEASFDVYKGRAKGAIWGSKPPFSHINLLPIKDSKKVSCGNPAAKTVRPASTPPHFIKHQSNHECESTRDHWGAGENQSIDMAKNYV